MTSRVFQSAAARRDVIEHYVYLAEKAGESTAERFLVSLESSVSLLLEQPLLGAPLTLRAEALQNLRKWSVKGFENVLIFYSPRQDGIALVRVLHAAQNRWSLLSLVP